MDELEWPVHRHDRLLSGRTSGKGSMRQPSIAGTAQYAPGGAPELWIEDIDGDGRDEYIFVESGRIRVKDGSGRLLWQSGVCHPFVVGFHDLAGTGERCVVAVAHARTLLILSGKDGALAWSYEFDRKTVVLTHNKIRVGPIFPQLAGEQITVWPEGDDWGYLFSFENGIGSGRLVWKSPGIGVGPRTRYRPSVLVGDIQGFGRPAIIVVQHTITWVVDPADGAIQYQIDGPKLRNYGLAELIDVDGDGVSELVFVNDSVQLRTSVVKWREGAFEYVWSRYLGDNEHVMTAPYVPILDIDGDGKPEIVYSIGETEGRVWSVAIVDAASGSVKLNIPDARLLDCGDMDGDGVSELLLEHSSGAFVSIRKPIAGLDEEMFKSDGVPVARLEGIRTLTRNHTNYQRGHTYFHDVDGDGRKEFVLRRGDRAVAYGCGDDGLIGERRALCSGMTVLNAFYSNGLYCLLGRADGFLKLLAYDGGREDEGNGKVVASFPHESDVRIRLPIVADIDADGVPEIIAGNAVFVVAQGRENGALDLREKRSFRSPPEAEMLLAWDFDGDGRKELLFAGADAELLLTDCSGNVRWRKKLMGDLKESNVISCAAGRFLPGGRYDIYVNAAFRAVYMNESIVLRSDTGETVWRRNDGHDSGMGPVEGFAAVKPLERDDCDDLLFLSGETVMGVDGATGRDLIEKKELAHILGTEWIGFGQLTLADVDGDGEEEAFLSGIWGLNGGVMKRGEGGWSNVWRDYYGNDTPIGTPPRGSHQGLAMAGGRMLAGGQRADYLYGCVDAASGTLLWTYDLGNSLIGDTCTGDVDGDGNDEFVFGCNDGHFYALKHDGTLLFKLFAGAPPGSPVLADVDGDGRIEIVATLLDGRLIVVK